MRDMRSVPSKGDRRRSSSKAGDFSNVVVRHGDRAMLLHEGTMKSAGFEVGGGSACLATPDLLGIWSRLSSACHSRPSPGSPEWRHEDEAPATRLELVQMLYARIVDPHEFASPSFLYDPGLFDFREVLTLRARLGIHRCIDLANVHTPASPAGSATTNAATAVAPIWVFAVAEPESRNAVARIHGNIFVFDLSLHEDWRLAVLLLHLAKNEVSYSCQTVDCMWSEIGGTPPRADAVFFPPDTWAKESCGPPRSGLFTFRYICSKIGELPAAQVSLRWKIGQEWLGRKQPAAA